MDNKFETNENFALKLDEQDTLGRFRSRFYIPPGTIYLDGNSLGLMPLDAEKNVLGVLNEWKEKGIDGWLGAAPPWFYFAETVGAMAAPLVGAAPDEVVATATTTVNIHSLISSFYKPAGSKKKILSDELNFPSDIYALKGQIKLKNLDPAQELVLVKSRDGCTLDENDIVKAMSDEIALAFFSSVLYRSGQLLDLEYLAREAHKRGIIIGFDCCHSVGAVPHKYDDWGIDFAMWCSYKYLNGGPGAPAFLYVNRKHFNKDPLLIGWFGSDKERQFEMSLDFHRANNAGAWQISSPGILGLAPVQGSLDIFGRAGIAAIRQKSLNMTAYLIFLVDNILSPPPYGFAIVTPRDPARRGGHAALQPKQHAWGICQALKARRVIPDFRPPDIIRVAPVALYNTYHEVWRAVHILKDIIDNKEYLEFLDKKSSIT